MLKKIARFPIFGLLIGILPFLILWNNNKTQVYARDVVSSLLLTMAFVVVFWALFLLITRSAARASLASTLFFLLFFSFGHVYNLVQNKVFLGISIGFIKLLAAYLVLAIVFTFLLIRVKKITVDVTLWLNAILGVLILFNLFQIIQFEIIHPRQPVVAAAENPPSSTTASGTSSGELPDIYYIILDAYSRQDVLKDIMNYDNSAFIDGLRQRGFYVADCASSNYDGTVASVTSSLNYSYLAQSANLSDIEDKALSNDLVNNRIRNDLAQRGYQFVTSKAYSSANDIPNSDIYLDYLTDAGMADTVAQAQFTRMYLETTLFRVPFELYYMSPLKFAFLPDWLFMSDDNDSVMGYASFWYNQTKYVFDSLEKFPSRDGNYFVYAHINAPHGPYVFDSNGNFRYTYNPEDNLPYYTDTITWLDKRVLKLIDNLIADSKVPPIIILQGDHGAHVLTSGIDKNKILSAYYFPGNAKSDLYPTITPVNTFRLVLRDYFSQQMDLLPDTVYAKITNDYEPIPSSCDVP